MKQIRVCLLGIIEASGVTEKARSSFCLLFLLFFRDTAHFASGSGTGDR